ncbi:MAG: hypothetical protein KGZ58_06830, partial [Ignavibacteriales bacterium]|nr:hypothetical protein [Ignavibacteriales bacterium]
MSRSETYPSPQAEAIPAKTDPDRKYILERVGAARVVQLYADGFEILPLREKIFAYYLSQAAIAGRDIGIDQHHRNALEIRDLLESIVNHADGIDPKLLEKISTYLKLFWLNNGFYDNLTSRKITPEFSFEGLRAATKIALSNGAQFHTTTDDIDTKLF